MRCCPSSTPFRPPRSTQAAASPQAGPPACWDGKEGAVSRLQLALDWILAVRLDQPDVPATPCILQVEVLESWLGMQLQRVEQMPSSPQLHQQNQDSGDLVQEAGGSRQLLLYGSTWLDLSALDGTSEAAEAFQHEQLGDTQGSKGICQVQHEPAAAGTESPAARFPGVREHPITVTLPLSLAGLLLRHHPSEGVRWQVRLQQGQGNSVHQGVELQLHRSLHVNEQVPPLCLHPEWARLGLRQ